METYIRINAILHSDGIAEYVIIFNLYFYAYLRFQVTKTKLAEDF